MYNCVVTKSDIRFKQAAPGDSISVTLVLALLSVQYSALKPVFEIAVYQIPIQTGVLLSKLVTNCLRP